MASVTCPCGTVFEAQSKKARYCSARCRQRASRAGLTLARVSPIPARQPPPTPDSVGSVMAAVITELEAASALGSAAGLAAVKLAQLIDSADVLGGSACATWSREMRAALAEAKSAAPSAEVDPIDELERKRAGRGA